MYLQVPETRIHRCVGSCCVNPVAALASQRVTFALVAGRRRGRASSRGSCRALQAARFSFLEPEGTLA